ncbi:MAG: right-handed parallel beta-helix repeat-containing protein [Sedimentisphaerales bacterium]|nr:right-handed parallel beta-helix repeat-containing protein [Sedimentisphaerales bacterium]
MISRKSMLMLVLSLFAASAYAGDLWVGTGQPYSNIRSAITAAGNGDVVIVKDGIYTGTDNTNLDFAGKTITVQSENGPDNCIIDCQNAANSTAFNFFMTGEPAAAVVDGFTITHATNNAININGGWDGSTCPTIQNCIIQDSSAYRGAGITCVDTTSLITDCTITECTATLGAGISIGGSNSPTVQNCVIDNNTAGESGGGIYCDPYMNPTIKNCLLSNNSAVQKGGAIFCDNGANPSIGNCTIVGNTAGYNGGGGIYCYSYYSSTSPTITDTIFANNTNFAVYEDGSSADPAVSYCHFYNNSVADYRDQDTWQWTGAFDININVANAHDNIDGDPLFLTGPWGDYYLSQVGAGTLGHSPCINSGSDTAINLGLNNRTTRIDSVYDVLTVDIGYHYPDPPAALYELTASVVGGHGTIYPTSGSYGQDTPVDLTATPDTGYRVYQWTGTDDDTSRSTINQVTMNSSKTVTVEFAMIPPVLYVDDDGPGEPLEDGSVTYPYDSIQEAVDMIPANGTVIVLDGTYTGSGNTGISFNGKNLTLQSQNGSQNCVIDCEFGNRAFFLENNTTDESVIDGFTITRGSTFEGGAMYLSLVAPVIRNCVFTYNQATGSNTGGGAIVCFTADPTIENCVFYQNYAIHFGGAIQLRASSAPTISNSVFIDNDADNAGGGIYIKLSSATIGHCRFTANSSVTAGGGIYSSTASYSVTNCVINNNTTEGSGGGIYCYESAPSVENCIFTQNNNHAIAESGSTADPCVNYNSFYNNPNSDYYDSDTATSYSGAVQINSNMPQAAYNIDGDPLFADNGSWDDNGTPANPDDDTWVDGDYHLQSQAGRWDAQGNQWVYDVLTSSCVDAGNPNSTWTTELWPHGRRINLGLYGNTRQASMSNSTVGSAADLDNNNTVDEIDLISFVSSWLVNDPLAPSDTTRNGTTNIEDLGPFSKDWQQPID